MPRDKRRSKTSGRPKSVATRQSLSTASKRASRAALSRALPSGVSRIDHGSNAKQSR